MLWGLKDVDDNDASDFKFSLPSFLWNRLYFVSFL